jgi:hypothetical protein
MFYSREGVSVDYTVSVVVELDADEPPLRPTRGGAPVVKFTIVKPGGTRVRTSSRVNSKEVGWVSEGSVVCIDQKEWFYKDQPDPDRLHPNSGFWRVHVIDSGKKPPLTGWITGKSNVIDPVQPSPFFAVGVPVLVGASDVRECGMPKGFTQALHGSVSRCDVTKLKIDSYCCLPVGNLGQVKLELKLDRGVLWKMDDGEEGMGEEEMEVMGMREGSRDSMDGADERNR